MKSVPLAEMSQATFAELLHTRFRVRANETTLVEIELVEATAHQPSQGPAPSQTGSFSLLFTGPLNPFLPQRTYVLQHEKLGVFDLFIVPVGKDQNGFQYEAIFNRPGPPGARDSRGSP